MLHFKACCCKTSQLACIRSSLVGYVKQTYKLALTPQYRGIHPVFHVSLLEPYHARDRIIPTTEPILIDSEERWEVKDIIDKRLHYGKIQYLVKWQGWTEAENSWEPVDNLDGAQDLVDKFDRQYPDHLDRGPRTRKRR
ncbi:hypothetical protein ACJ73_10172 [Blastomyces percursus]|uniref:Chromo domain-containing protein n=1 Tax=Blastomyces percursus TaxID=1658174 RepID=A0A1J9Q054_9EURO|nr:hypothetical protein ACJ73_10172 [Blastomyces percursus]